MISKTQIFVVLSTCLLAGCEPNNALVANKKAPVVSGVDFDSAKIYAIDAATNKSLSPCTPFTASEKSATADGKAKETCKAELIVGDNPEIKAAIELAKAPIQGRVKTQDGKEKPARVVVTVTTLYEGSYCTTIFSGGVQYNICFP